MLASGPPSKYEMKRKRESGHDHQGDASAMSSTIARYPAGGTSALFTIPLSGLHIGVLLEANDSNNLEGWI